MDVQTGKKYRFDSHGQDSYWKNRDGQYCLVMRPLTEEEADLDDVGPMYHVRFDDGEETEVFEDELILI